MPIRFFVDAIHDAVEIFGPESDEEDRNLQNS
jgi:hypothetical protein